jgi:hypothetical protein
MKQNLSNKISVEKIIEKLKDFRKGKKLNGLSIKELTSEGS